MIIDKMPNASYREANGVSKSDLDLISRSVSHWKNKQVEQTKAMILGSAFHDSILLPETFESSYFIEPKFNKRTKEGKAEYEAFLKENVGKTPLEENDFDRIIAMRDKVLLHPVAKKILNGAIFEQSCFSRDTETDIDIKCRPDILRLEDCIIADLKTTQDASPLEFSKSIANYCYDKQAAFYCDILSKITSAPFTTFIFIAVEKNPPHEVAIYDANEAMIQIGREMYRRDLNKLKAWIDGKESEGYPVHIRNIDLPNWAKQIENR